MSLNSNARAVCQFITAHAFLIPRQALIFRLHCFSKQPWHRLSKRLCTNTRPCHGGLESGEAAESSPTPEVPEDGSLVSECSTINLREQKRVETSCSIFRLAADPFHIKFSVKLSSTVAKCL